MSRPTNTQIVTAPLDIETERIVRETCKAQGCTCGDRLVITTRELRGDDRPLEARGYAKASQVDVRHDMCCPLLARQGVN